MSGPAVNEEYRWKAHFYADCAVIQFKAIGVDGGYTVQAGTIRWQDAVVGTKSISRIERDENEKDKN
jgi:hypothetical protein